MTIRGKIGSVDFEAESKPCGCLWFWTVCCDRPAFLQSEIDPSTGTELGLCHECLACTTYFYPNDYGSGESKKQSEADLRAYLTTLGAVYDEPQTETLGEGD